MSYVMGTISVPLGSVTPLFRIPSGLCNVSFWNNNTAATVYVGASTSVTFSNGLTCHSLPTGFFSYVSSGGAQFYATAATSPGTISYLIVTDQ